MCIEKLSNTCVKSYAKCVMYEGTIPDFSGLSSNTCVNVEEAVQDLYGIVESHYTALLTDGLEAFCITFDTNAEGDITQREINLGVIATLCELKTIVDALNPDSGIDMSKIDMTECNLNLVDFVDACGENIQDFCGLVQALIDSAVAQQASIDTLTATVATQATTISGLETRISTLEAFHP